MTFRRNFWTQDAFISQTENDDILQIIKKMIEDW